MLKPLLCVLLVAVLSMGCRSNQLPLERALAQPGDFPQAQAVVDRALFLDGFKVMESRLIADLANKMQKEGALYLKSKNIVVAQQQWKGFVIDDTLLTFIAALPNGSLYVSKGVEKLAEQLEERFAMFVSHAVAHVMLGHNQQRIESILVSEFGGMTLANAIRQAQPHIGRQLLIACGAAIPGLATFPYGPNEEREADLLSMHMIHRNNYKVPQTIYTWARLSAAWPQTRVLDMVHPGRSERYNRMREYAATQKF